MKTPYLDKYIRTLKKEKREGTLSFYQSRKLKEFIKIKEHLKQ